MAVSDTARLALTRWSAGTDPLSRTQLDGDHATLEELVAIDRQGTHAQRPTANVRGTYYFCLTHGLVYRNDGTTWVTIGSPLSDALPSVGPRDPGTSATVSRGDHSHGPSSSKGFTMSMMGA